jgi:hypothetical protein
MMPDNPFDPLTILAHVRDALAEFAVHLKHFSPAAAGYISGQAVNGIGAAIQTLENERRQTAAQPPEGEKG